MPLRDIAYFNAALHDVTVLAGSGDTGATNYELDGVTLYPYRMTSWPSSDPLVTSLGGSILDLNQAGNRLEPDAVWKTGSAPAVAAFRPRSRARATRMVCVRLSAMCVALRTSA